MLRLRRMDGWTDRRTQGWGGKGGSGRKRSLRAYRAGRTRGNISFLGWVCSHLSAAGRRSSRAGTGRDARGGGEPRSWVGPAQGPPPAVGDSPPGTSPIPTPLSFLSAWRAEASPINFIFLLICSPFRNSGSTDLSLPPSQKYRVFYPAEAGHRQPGMLPHPGPGITLGGLRALVPS